MAATFPYMTAPAALILAYGAARASTVFCTEARNMAFAKVGGGLMQLKKAMWCSEMTSCPCCNALGQDGLDVDVGCHLCVSPPLSRCASTCGLSVVGRGNSGEVAVGRGRQATINTCEEAGMYTCAAHVEPVTRPMHTGHPGRHPACVGGGVQPPPRPGPVVPPVTANR